MIMPLSRRKTLQEARLPAIKRHFRGFLVKCFARAAAKSEAVSLVLFHHNSSTEKD